MGWEYWYWELDTGEGDRRCKIVCLNNFVIYGD